MKLLSHVHIHDGDYVANGLHAGEIAQKHGHTHIAMGCHNWFAPADLMRCVEESFGIKCIRYAELDTFFEYPGQRYRSVQVAAYNLDDFNWFKPFGGFIETANKIHNLGGKFVLVHPDSELLFDLVRHYIDGCEIFNAIQNKTYDYVLKWANITPFRGADWHVWPPSDKHPDGGLGDPTVFTELPDDWFGEIKL